MTSSQLDANIPEPLRRDLGNLLGQFDASAGPARGGKHAAGPEAAGRARDAVLGLCLETKLGVRSIRVRLT